jgi:hypothetical protein
MSSDRDSLDQMLSDVQDDVLARPRWRRVLSERSTPERLFFVSIVALAVVAFVLVAGRRADWDAFPLSRRMMSLGGLSILAFGALLIGVGRPDASSSRARLGVFACICFGTLFATALLPAAHDATHAHPESFEGAGADFWTRAGGCFLFGSLLSVPILILFVLVQRDRISVGAYFAGAISAGLVANVGLSIHCPLVNRLHLLVGHASIPIALFTVLTFSVIRRRAM